MLLKQLAPESTPAEDIYLRSRKGLRLNAMESYVRGLMATTLTRIKFFSQAVKLDDHFPQAEFQLGRLEFQDKDYKKAAEWLGKVSRTDFHYLEASFLLAICRIYSGDYDSAIQLLKIVLAELPLNEVYNNLGVALTRKNDSGAVGSFQRAIEGDQGDPDYWFNAGYALWKFGQYAAAADRFRAVLDRSSGVPEHDHVRRAIASEAMGPEGMSCGMADGSESKQRSRTPHSVNCRPSYAPTKKKTRKNEAAGWQQVGVKWSRTAGLQSRNSPPFRFCGPKDCPGRCESLCPPGVCASTPRHFTNSENRCDTAYPAVSGRNLRRESAGGVLPPSPRSVSRQQIRHFLRS